MHGQLYFTTLLFLAAMATTTAQQPTAPAPAAEVGYAKARGKFYVYGGRTGPAANAVTGQFFELDLTKPWKADAPAWSQLPAGPKKTRVFMAMSTDGKKLIVNAVDDCSATHYSGTTKTWTVQEGSPWRCLSQMDPFLVTVEPTNTAIFVESDDTMGNTWYTDYQFPNDMSTGSWQIPPFGGMGGVDYLPSRGHYKAGWSKHLASIVVYGGLSIPSTASINQWVSLFDPKSKQWKTLKTTGANEKTSVDHCVAVTDGGKRLFSYGGRVAGTGPYRSTLYILDLTTGVWTEGANSGKPRGAAACVATNDHFIVWGGLDKDGNVADAGKPSAPVMIYQIAQDKWVTDFDKPSTPPSSDDGSGESSSDEEPDSPTSNKSSSSSSNVGGVVGGVFGALAVIGAALGFFWWRRKQQRKISSDKYWYGNY
ncbi:hypothetical protein DFQ26_004344 [Actinomortierella ambigua]|nr:hypothetical protein DFQ26_004344 [Actinomortierella ambigua]